MKAIMLSNQPKWTKKSLNGEKKIEVRKRFTSDYVGWLYIYVTKDTNNLLHKNCANIWWVEDKDFQKKNKRLGVKQQPIYNGKVVARFWCDKVEEIDVYTNRIYETKTLNQSELLEKSCLTHSELFKYLGEDYSKIGGYAIHISDLEIFDKPKELSEFYYFKKKLIDCGRDCPPYVDEVKIQMHNAPQSWQYIEVEE